MSAYLDCGESQTQPINWTRRASFKLSMVNQRDHTKTICKGMSICGSCANVATMQMIAC